MLCLPPRSGNVDISWDIPICCYVLLFAVVWYYVLWCVVTCCYLLLCVLLIECLKLVMLSLSGCLKTPPSTGRIYILILARAFYNSDDMKVNTGAGGSITKLPGTFKTPCCYLLLCVVMCLYLFSFISCCCVLLFVFMSCCTLLCIFMCCRF